MQHLLSTKKTQWLSVLPLLVPFFGLLVFVHDFRVRLGAMSVFFASMFIVARARRFHPLTQGLIAFSGVTCALILAVLSFYRAR